MRSGRRRSGAARTRVARTQDRFGLWPARLAADSAMARPSTSPWLVHERGIEPHIPVFGKSERSDGTFCQRALKTSALVDTFSRSAFTYDPAADAYTARLEKR